MRKDTMMKAWMKLSQAGAFPSLAQGDFTSWRKENSERIENMIEYVRNLRQGKVVAESDIVAWLYSFDARTAKNDVIDKERILSLMKKRMKAITPYECATIMREFEENTPVWFRGRAAESIRRSMLMLDLYASDENINAPERKLVRMAISNMRSICQETAYKIINKEYGLSETSMQVLPVLDGPVAAVGNRYGEISCFTRQGGKSFPCLFVLEKDDANEFAYAPEAGALALDMDEDKIGGAFVCFISPKTYDISVAAIPPEIVLAYRQKASESLDVFWTRHVAGNQEFSTKTKAKRQPLDAGLSIDFEEISREIGKLHMVMKKIEERDGFLRERLASIVMNYAEDNGLPVESVQTPSCPVSMIRSKVVDKEEVQRLINSMPEAANQIFSKLEPDKDMMVAYMKEHGVNEALWKKGKVDPDMLCDFCERNGIDPPVRVNVSFRIDARSKKAREELENTLADAGEALELLGCGNDASQTAQDGPKA